MSLYGHVTGTNALFAGLMLESALGTDLERFGDYQTRLVKLNPKLGGEGAALPAPSTNNTPATAAPVTALSGSALSATALSGIPPADQTDAITPGDRHTTLLLLHNLTIALVFGSGSGCLCVQNADLR